MTQLIPTPVVLQNLVDDAADINLFNDGVKTQAASPRTQGQETITVQVLDDPLAPTVDSGTADGTTASKLIDSGATWLTTLDSNKEYSVINTTDDTSAVITAIDSDTSLSLSADIFITAETYVIIERSLWTQMEAGGEWKKGDYKKGDNIRATYNLPTPGTASTIVVHGVVYPVTSPEDTGNYPPATNA